MSAHIVVALSFLWVFAPAAFAEAVRGIRFATPRAMAPRGGVLLAPLTAERPGDHWPVELELAFDGGGSITGTVIWIGPRVVEGCVRRGWTDDPAWIAARTPEPGDDSSIATSGMPYVAVRMPGDGAAEALRLGRNRLELMWRDLPVTPSEAFGPVIDHGAMCAERPGDWPDPYAATEYWRWTMIAPKRNMQPFPSTVYGEAGGLVAEHYDQLWRLALNKLYRLEPTLADTVEHLLTATCADESTQFGVWVADPNALATLLTSLLDEDRPRRTCLADVQTWIDVHSRLLFWSEADYDRTIRMVMINRSRRMVAARLSWEDVEDIPLAVDIVPGEMTRVLIDRPEAVVEIPLVAAQVDERAEPLVLRIDAGSQPVRMAFRETVRGVRPPGSILGPFLPSISLAEAEMRQQRPMARGFATSAQVRRLKGRWEVFFECLRRPEDARDEAARELGTFGDWRDVRAVEAVTILLGKEDDPALVLTVPETGWHRLFVGQHDDSLQIHRRSMGDRWRCRVVLPDVWLDDFGVTEGILIGLIRTHGNSLAVETAPNTSSPWRQRPARVRLDLTAWEE